MSSIVPDNLFRVLFLDVETASGEEHFDDLSVRMKNLWERKCAYWMRNDQNGLTIADFYKQKAAIYAEFGQVVCISAGYLNKGEDGLLFKIKSWFGSNEYNLLTAFAALLRTHFNAPLEQGFCGHNIKEFDIPYLCRRMLVNGIDIPDVLNIQGKKPWEVNQIYDTLEMWKFGDYKHFVSLDLLSAVFDIRSPKEYMDGSMVSDYYYRYEQEKIATYCEDDVLTVLKIYLRLLNLSCDFEVIHVQNERYD